MKIAIVTDNGKRVSAHFGKATHVLVITAEDGKEVAREMRDKPFHGAHDHNHDHNHVHVHDGNQDHHHGQGGFFQQVKAIIADCDVLIARGMGQPAFDQLQQSGIRPILADEGDVETAVSAVLADELTHNPCGYTTIRSSMTEPVKKKKQPRVIMFSTPSCSYGEGIFSA